jgi:hypothetical protein
MTFHHHPKKIMTMKYLGEEEKCIVRELIGNLILNSNTKKLEALLADLGPHLNHPTNKSGALSAKQQLCIALHWLGSGSAYHVISDAHGVSKAAVCRSIPQCSINCCKY